MTTEYIVSWKKSLGVEPCGRADYEHNSKRFLDEEAARNLYYTVSRCHEAKLKKVTTEVLEERD